MGKDVRVCPSCSAENVDETACWMCHAPLPPATDPSKVRRAGPEPDWRRRQQRAQQILVTLGAIPLIVGAAGLTGAPVLLGVLLIPALLVTHLASAAWNESAGGGAGARLLRRILTGVVAAVAVLMIVAFAVGISCVAMGAAFIYQESTSGHH